MRFLSKYRLLLVPLLVGAFFVSGSSFAADYPLADKLQQCEVAFEKMHSGDLTQEEAWSVRREHKKLVKEIIQNLNMANHKILQSDDRAMSSDEILSNLVVMGSLLEMLVTENLTVTDEWGYPVNH